MFQTLSWVIGDEPLINLNGRVQTLDVVAQTCLEDEPLVYDRRKNVSIVLESEGAKTKLHLSSIRILTVRTFIDFINQQGSKYVDNLYGPKIVDSMSMEDDKIVVKLETVDYEI